MGCEARHAGSRVVRAGAEVNAIDAPDGIGRTLLVLGGIFLAGLAADLVGRRTALPRVTLLLLVGFAVGPGGLDWIPAADRAWLPAAADMALLMVGFLLGGELTAARLRRHGRAVIVVSIVVVLATVTVVAAGLAALGWEPAIALVVAAVATATDPAAVSDVVHETRSDGPFTRTLLGVVAIDDAWGLVAVSVLLAAALAVSGRAGPEEALLHGLYDLGGAVAVGVGLGVPLALLTGRVRPGEPTLAEALGAVLLCGGVAKGLGVSFLLAAMVMGAVVANRASHHRRPFRAIEGIEWPFMILFFVLAGASFRLDGLVGAVGGLAAAYLALRTLGRVAGGWLGARLAGHDRTWRRWTGLALLPQAGVALGMALVVAQRFPELGRAIVPAVVATTVAFELVGPLLTRIALVRADEVGHAVAPGAESFAPDADDDEP